MKKMYLITLLLAVFFVGRAQTETAYKNLKLQVVKMTDAFISKDYKTFVSYNYRPMVQATGGPSKTAANISKAVDDLKTKGMEFSKITTDEPSKIIKNGSEYQATVTQHSALKLVQGRLEITSTLIAISADNGANWTFVDTANKDLTKLRRAMPNLSPSIVIPPSQPPVRYNN